MGKEIEIKVVIPSAERADIISTHQHIKNSIVVVPESEFERYTLSCPGTEIVKHPPLKGLGAKRNWILEKFGSVFMIDDDCKGMTRLYEDDSKRSKVDAETAYQLIQYTGNLCKMAGFFMFGFARWNNPMRCHGLNPLRMKGLAFGGGMGFIEGNHLKFSDKIKCNNDIFISLLNAYKHRGAWIDERFSLKYDGYGATKGGLAKHRTVEVEKQDFELLQKYFGDAVQKKKSTWASKVTKPFEKNIVLPF